jgi:hypothetical protein
LFFYAKVTCFDGAIGLLILVVWSKFDGLGLVIAKICNVYKIANAQRVDLKNKDKLYLQLFLIIISFFWYNYNYIYKFKTYMVLKKMLNYLSFRMEEIIILINLSNIYILALNISWNKLKRA